VETFRARGIRYIRNLSPVKGSGYSWQEAFETDDRIEAERSCARIGADFEWRPDGVLRISQVRPATAHHPLTGEEVWFNQADGFHPSALLPDVYAAALAEVGSEDRFRLNVTYGDGARSSWRRWSISARCCARDTVCRTAGSAGTWWCSTISSPPTAGCRSAAPARSLWR
jgi:hypothetical protein